MFPSFILTFLRRVGTGRKLRMLATVLYDFAQTGLVHLPLDAHAQQPLAPIVLLSIYHFILLDGLLMDKHSHTIPDPDFSPSIPVKPVPATPVEPVTDPFPNTPDEEELPSPPIFPTA